MREKAPYNLASYFNFVYNELKKKKLRKYILRDLEDGSVGKYLAYKHWEHGLDPGTHIKKPGVAPCTSYPTAKEEETGAALVVAGQPD